MFGLFQKTIWIEYLSVESRTVAYIIYIIYAFIYFIRILMDNCLIINYITSPYCYINRQVKPKVSHLLDIMKMSILQKSFLCLIHVFLFSVNKSTQFTQLPTPTFGLVWRIPYEGCSMKYMSFAM